MTSNPSVKTACTRVDGVCLNDQALVNLARQPGTDGRRYMNALLNRYAVRLHSFCTGYLHDTAEADDACQEIMLRVMRGLAGYRGQAPFRSWLFRIAANVCHSRYGTRRRWNEHYLSLDQSETEPVAPDAAIENTGIRHGDFENLLDTLSAREKRIMRLRFEQDAELGDVAKAMGMKLSACKMCYYRALDKLRERHARPENTAGQPEQHGV